ncbi:MAG: hypothetical protein M3405_05690 [Acidobacteriota bacterium]|jgi:hypothetical protein|nr:hypothetical protein [Acidobacteriota bacterium]
MLINKLYQQLFFGILISIIFVFSINCSNQIYEETSNCKILNKNIPYKVIRDQFDTIVEIIVNSDLNKDELCTAMTQAADELQDSPARDYLTAEYLWIEAYSFKEDNLSKYLVGKLRRQVFVDDKKLKDVDDLIILNLEESQQDLNNK